MNLTKVVGILAVLAFIICEIVGIPPHIGQFLYIALGIVIFICANIIANSLEQEEE